MQVPASLRASFTPQSVHAVVDRPIDDRNDSNAAWRRFCSRLDLSLALDGSCPRRLETVPSRQLGRSLVEKRERRQLYQSALDGWGQGEGQSEDSATSTTMRLENEIEQAQKQRLEVSALTGAAQQVRWTVTALARVVLTPNHNHQSIQR